MSRAALPCESSCGASTRIWRKHTRPTARPGLGGIGSRGHSARVRALSSIRHWSNCKQRRLPFGGISETAVNAALAMIEAAAPKDEIEGALAVQMACTHTAAMAVLARLGGGHGSELRVAALGSAAARLLRAYATQVEVLRRLRHGGQQYVRVEHVYVNDGGQAVIGNVKQPEMRG